MKRTIRRGGIAKEKDRGRKGEGQRKGQMKKRAGRRLFFTLRDLPLLLSNDSFSTIVFRLSCCRHRLARPEVEECVRLSAARISRDMMRNVRPMCAWDMGGFEELVAPPTAT